jgi:hypothetical protein
MSHAPSNWLEDRCSSVRDCSCSCPDRYSSVRDCSCPICSQGQALLKENNEREIDAMYTRGITGDVPDMLTLPGSWFPLRNSPFIQGLQLARFSGMHRPYKQRQNNEESWT